MSIKVRKRDFLRPAYFRGLTAGQQLERELTLRMLKKELADYQRGAGFSYPAALRHLISRIEARNE